MEIQATHNLNEMAPTPGSRQILFVKRLAYDIHRWKYQGPLRELCFWIKSQSPLRFDLPLDEDIKRRSSANMTTRSRLRIMRFSALTWLASLLHYPQRIVIVQGGGRITKEVRASFLVTAKQMLPGWFGSDNFVPSYWIHTYPWKRGVMHDLIR